MRTPTVQLTVSRLVLHRTVTVVIKVLNFIVKPIKFLTTIPKVKRMSAGPLLIKFKEKRVGVVRALSN